MPKIKIYVAASIPRIAEAEELAKLLRQKNYEIVSWWHEDDSSTDDTGYQSASRAVRDFYGVKSCDWLVVLVGDNLSRGGRHSELGVALGMNKSIMLIGGMDDCILTNLPWLNRFKNIEEFMSRIKRS